MADVITPDTFSGAFEMPATIGGGRMPRFTKEDLVRALLQTQAQPKSPYSLQFEAPVITGASPSGEEQFQRDWDTAMAQYQARIAQPRVLPQGITYGGQTNLDTPQAAFQETLAPLRMQAAMYDPDLSNAFAREAQAKHWENLAVQAAAREKRMEEYAQERKTREARLQSEFETRRDKTKLPSATDKNWLFGAKAEPAAWDKFDAIYGPGMAQATLGKGVKDPRPSQLPAGFGGEMPQTPSFFNPANLWRNPELPPASNLSMAAPEVFSTMPQAVTTLPGPPKLNEANMVLMVDREGKQWQVPADSVAKAEKTYGWKRQ